MGFWDLEEVVGRCWHRWVGAAESYPHFPEAAVEFEAVRPRLAVFFRGLGGPGGVRLAATGRRASRHRLNLRQRLGLGDTEAVDRPRLDAQRLLLPERLDCFAEHRLNERLYFWLAAYFAHAGAPPYPPADPLQCDLWRLRAAQGITRRTLKAWPGLRGMHAELTVATRAIRPARRLGGAEAAVEAAIVHLLGGAAPADPAGRRMLAIVLGGGSGLPAAPPGYRPFLPVPLWGELSATVAGSAGGRDTPGGGGARVDERHRAARRRDADQSRREDPLILNRFEHIPCLAEMVNLNREVEDDDEAGARQAADGLEEITLAGHERSAATRLKLDLDLAPAAADAGTFAEGLAYPEWDFRCGAYRADYCRVFAGRAEAAGADWVPDAPARRRIRAVRRQFEALRPRREVHPAQRDGGELDLNAVVRAVADRAAGGAVEDRVYLEARASARDLSVALLMDASLSTDSWVDDRRVLDVEKEAVLTLMHGLAACGDEFAAYAFTSRKRSWVRVQTLKDFDEPLNGAAVRRLQALRPGYYTRIGAALRHVSRCLEARAQTQRLLLLITDGKPNDADHYEGRYGLEDTRRAVREARRRGLKVFGVTVDSQARDYFPYLFGSGAYAVVSRVGRLPRALPALYRQITAT